jgi:hypothetical protein
MTATGELAEGLAGTCAGDFLSDGVLSDVDLGVAIDRGLGAVPRARASYELDAGLLFDNGGHQVPAAHPDNVAASAQQRSHFGLGAIIGTK